MFLLQVCTDLLMLVEDPYADMHLLVLFVSFYFAHMLRQNYLLRTYPVKSKLSCPSFLPNLIQVYFCGVMKIPNL